MCTCFHDARSCALFFVATMGASTSKHKIDNGMSPASSSKVSYEDDGDANANPRSLRR